MKIAYLIIAHKNPTQLIRLIDRLNSENSFFIVHYDKKSNIKEYDYLKKNLESRNNVYFIKKRIKIYWGEFSIIKIIIRLLNELKRLNVSYDYAILLSGDHYPIKLNKSIEKFLLKNNGYSFIQGSSMITGWGKCLCERYEKWHIFVDGKFQDYPGENFPIIIKRRFIKGFEPFYGSSWFCLSKEIVNYIIDFLKNNKKYARYFKFVHIPEESFFNTILYNSKYKNKIINDDLVYIKWPKPPEDTSHPYIITKNYFKELKNSKDLFARKFDSTIDSEILNLIDKEILGMRPNYS